MVPRMRHPQHRRFVVAVALATTCAGAFVAPRVDAQGGALGTFRWQLQPYCNVLTVTIVQQGAQYHVDGTDDLCGASRLASVVGRAFMNPDGTIGFGLTTVSTTGAAPVHIDARIGLSTLSGPWTDSAGNVGTFQFSTGPATGGGPRPVPPGGVAPGSITAVQLAPGSVTSVQLAPGSVTSTQLAPGSVGAAQLAPGVIAGVVAGFGTCRPGQYLRGIQPSGTVVCEPIGTPPATTSVSGGAVSGCCGSRSMVINRDGMPFIVGTDAGGQALAVTRCFNVTCSSATGQVIDDPANVVGAYAAVTIGSDGFPIIAHQDVTAQALRVTHCDNALCSLGATTSVTVDDPATSVGQDIAIAIGRDGLPIISHRALPGALRVTHCLDVACTKSMSQTIDNPPGTSVGLHTALAIGSDGLPIISHKDVSALALRVTHCLDVACQKSLSLNVDAPGNDVGRYSSIAIGRDGLAIISHYDNPPAKPYGNLRMTHCSNVACTAATSTTIDVGDNVTSAQQLGENTSLAIGADGLPVVSYRDYDGVEKLRVAHCDNAACTSATKTTVTASSGRGAALVIAPDGLPLFNHPGTTLGTVQVTKCASVTCR